MLVWRRFALSRRPLTNAGGPALRKCGWPVHRVPYRTPQRSNDPDDVMNLAEMASAEKPAPTALQRKK